MPGSGRKFFDGVPLGGGAFSIRTIFLDSEQNRVESFWAVQGLGSVAGRGSGAVVFSKARRDCAACLGMVPPSRGRHDCGASLLM